MSRYPFLLAFLVFAMLLMPAAALLAAPVAPQAWQGPIAPIDTGYGQWGAHGVSPATTFSFVSQGYTNTVTLYFPGDQTAAAPSFFFAPGWDVPCEGYGELLRFMASKGYVSVCDDYHEDSGAIGNQLYESFKEAASRYPTKIDISKVGFSGHSAGAGLLTSVGYRLSVGDGWGARGKFIFSSAPWIDFDLTDTMLANYPTDMKLIMQMNEDDTGTDLRTSIDQFENNTRIPDSEKDYIILRPASISGYNYLANHAVIGTGDGYGVYDAMDSYGIFRLMDALADYTFTGNPRAKAIALEQNYDADRQSEMGDLPDLISTDDPRPIPGLTSAYPCDIADNPRSAHCHDFDGELPAAVPVWPKRQALISQAAPTFTWEAIPTAVRYDLQIRPMLPSGEPDWGTSYGESDITAAAAGCDASNLCSYTLGSNLPLGDYVWWVMGYDAAAGGTESVWTRRNFFTRVANATYFPHIQSQILNSDDLRYNWQNQGDYQHFQIWRSTSPYFAPAGNPLHDISAAPWWAPDFYRIGDPAINYYYVIRGVKPGGTTTDQRVGEFDFGLIAGSSTTPAPHLYPPDTTYTPIFTDIPPMPDYLDTLDDTTTDTEIKRITQPDAAYGSEYPTHSYSKNQPWNANATSYKFYSVAVYDAETHAKTLTLPGNLYETFWSNTNPDLMYSFREAGEIKTYTISTGQQTTLYTLAGYDRVKLGPGEGNIDKNDHYVALVGKRGVDLDVIVFDLQASTVITTVTFAGAWGAGSGMPEHLDWASISQSGNYVVLNWDTGAPWDVHPWNGHFGIEVYNRDMTFHHRASRYGNHGDLCFAPNGDELYVQFWGEYGTINAYRLADTLQDHPYIVQDHTDFGYGDAHLSCRNLLRPGWAYVSVDHSKGGMVVAVKLDESRIIQYFGHHFSSTSSYKKSPMPVPNPWGDIIMFKSDFYTDNDASVAYSFEARYHPSAANGQP